eukprot:PITA_16333
MPGVYPSIILHEILTYPHVKPIHQWLHLVHPKKAVTIKGEVEKLLKFGFIYLISLTDYVSNIVSVTKKQASSTIAMVLVQDDDEGNEHVIYYLSHNILDIETCYTHVEKLALAVVQMSVTPHISFTDGAFRSTRNLSSTMWAIYNPHGELIDLQGIFLGRTTNNIVEYSAVIKLLSKSIALNILELVVNLDS